MNEEISEKATVSIENESLANVLKFLVDNTSPGTTVTIEGYVPKSGYIDPPEVNVAIKLVDDLTEHYNARHKAIESVSLSDIKSKFPDVEGIEDTFIQRKKKLLESFNPNKEKSDKPPRNSNTVYVSSGIKLALGDVIEEGLREVSHIILSGVEVDRFYVKSGTKKPVKSGIPVQVENAIEKEARNYCSEAFRTYALTEGSWKSITVDGKIITPNDVQLA